MTDHTSITLTRDSLPDFLAHSQLSTTVEVPEEHFMTELKLENPEDIISPLVLLDHFKTKFIPFEMIDFIFNQICNASDEHRPEVITKYTQILNDPKLENNKYATEIMTTLCNFIIDLIVKVSKYHESSHNHFMCKLIHATVTCNCLSIIKYFYDKYHETFDFNGVSMEFTSGTRSNIVQYASVIGRYDIVKYFHDIGLNMEHAAFCTVQYALKNREAPMTHCYKIDKRETLNYLIGLGDFDASECDLNKFVKFQDLDLFEYAMSNGAKDEYTDIDKIDDSPDFTFYIESIDTLSAIFKSQNVDFLKFYLVKKEEAMEIMDKHLYLYLNYMAFNKELNEEFIEYLFSIFSFDEMSDDCQLVILVFALRTENDKIIDYFKDKQELLKVNIGWKTLTSIVDKNNFKTFKFLVDCNVSVNECVLYLAEQRGYYEIFKYGYEKGLPFYRETKKCPWIDDEYFKKTYSSKLHNNVDKVGMTKLHQYINEITTKTQIPSLDYLTYNFGDEGQFNSKYIVFKDLNSVMDNFYMK